MKRFVVTSIFLLLIAVATFMFLKGNGEVAISASFDGRTNISTEAPTPATSLLAVTTSSTGKRVATNSALIEALARSPHRSHLQSKIRPFTFAEEDQLLSIYRKTELTNRFGVFHALACGGGDRSFVVFRDSLEREFAGRSLNFQEEGKLLLIARFLGLLAPRSPQAWEYLKAGCFPAYWDQVSLWKGERHNTASYLADYCVQGVGAAGTPEARVFLEELTTRFSHRDAVDLYSAVLSAAAALDIAEEHGYTGFLDEIFMREPEEYEFYVKWKASDKAKPWLEWRDAIKSTPLLAP